MGRRHRRRQVTFVCRWGNPQRSHLPGNTRNSRVRDSRSCLGSQTCASEALGQAPAAFRVVELEEVAVICVALFLAPAAGRERAEVPDVSARCAVIWVLVAGASRAIVLAVVFLVRAGLHAPLVIAPDLHPAHFGIVSHTKLALHYLAVWVRADGSRCQSVIGQCFHRTCPLEWAKCRSECPCERHARESRSLSHAVLLSSVVVLVDGRSSCYAGFSGVYLATEQPGASSPSLMCKLLVDHQR